MNGAYLFAALMASLIINIVQLVLHYREKGEIFNRFMATDYRSYQYHKKEYQSDIDHKKETYKKMDKEKPKSPTELEMEKRAKGF